ncbi:MAG TPA: mycothiol conjugate amidase Mca [Acidimicrobiales bacterium]|nr:mycothiol conjugate amidase Mca [Acidimicrobiales bacterium]
MEDRLCILTVHAHPDDESSKGAGTIAKYAAAGAHTVLVCATDGAAGEILNPAMDSEEVKADLPAVRMEELARAAEIIGYREVIHLGYKDSGMPETPANEDPACFWRADVDEAVGRLVEIVRRTKPHVIVTYGDDQSGYPHPDHLRVHDISLPAFDLAADPSYRPDLGEAWEPKKLYYTAWSRQRMVAMHEKFLELGMESPFGDRFLDRPSQDGRITTKIDVSDHMDVRRNALLAHATQIDPTSPFWFGLPPEVSNTVYPVEDYVLARSRVPVPEGLGADGHYEDDLFAGVRASEGADR